MLWGTRCNIIAGLMSPLLRNWNHLYICSSQLLKKKTQNGTFFPIWRWYRKGRVTVEMMSLRQVPQRYPVNSQRSAVDQKAWAAFTFVKQASESLPNRCAWASRWTPQGARKLCTFCWVPGCAAGWQGLMASLASLGGLPRAQAGGAGCKARFPRCRGRGGGFAGQRFDSVATTVL